MSASSITDNPKIVPASLGFVSRVSEPEDRYTLFLETL